VGDLVVVPDFDQIAVEDFRPNFLAKSVMPGDGEEAPDEAMPVPESSLIIGLLSTTPRSVSLCRSLWPTPQSGVLCADRLSKYGLVVRRLCTDGSERTSTHCARTPLTAWSAADWSRATAKNEISARGLNC
jgi:hypothetical protein